MVLVEEIEKISILLKKLLKEDLSIEIIENDWYSSKDIVRNGIKFDNEKTCFYGYSSIDEMAFCIISDSIIYNVLYNHDQIGLASVFNYQEKEDEVEIAICLDKKYRNMNFGSRVLKMILNDCFFNGVNKVHALIRVDNVASNKLVEKLNFKKYEDDCIEDFVTDDNKVIKQNHYVITKKEN